MNFSFDLSGVSFSDVAVWGTVHRLVALLMFIGTVQWYWQILIFSGEHGIAPLRLRLARLKRDIPWYWFRFPTLGWICSADWFMIGVVLAGSVASLCAFVGFGHSSLMLAISFSCYATISDAYQLSFPWDDMILETTFLCLFLPRLPYIGTTWNAAAVPLPVVAFSIRWLAFRVMVGFGKHKFVGATSDDNDYLRGFTIGMPLPSRVSWLMHHAPHWFHVVSLAFMFVTECVLPIGFLMWGPWRLVAGLGTIALMAGIHLCGNWGHFNLLTAVCGVAALDLTSPSLPYATATGSIWTATAYELGVFAFLGVFLLPFSLVAFAGNTWGNKLAWWLDGLEPLPGISVMRMLVSWRVLHGYGVFPPASFPPLKHTPVIEGSADGITWHRYVYNYQVCAPTTKPPHIAPYHPRLDFFMFYQSAGIDRSPLQIYSDPIPAIIPLFMHRVAYLLLSDKRGEYPITHAFKHNPFPPGTPPRYVRVRLMAYRPEWDSAKPDVYWKETVVATHLPVVQLGCRALEPVVEYFSPASSGQPLLYARDASYWRAANPCIARLLRAFERSGDLTTALATNCGASWAPFTPDEITLFWDVCIGQITAGRTFSDIALIRADMRAKFTPAVEARMRLLHGALLSLFIHHTDKLWFSRTRGTFEVPAEADAIRASLPGVFHVSLLCDWYMCQGRQRFSDALKAVSALRTGPPCLSLSCPVWNDAVALRLDVNPAPGFVLMGAFSGDELWYMASKARLLNKSLRMDVYQLMKREPCLPTFFKCLPWLLSEAALKPAAAWEHEWHESYLEAVKVDGVFYFVDDTGAYGPPAAAARGMTASAAKRD